MKTLNKVYPFLFPVLLLFVYFIYSPGFSAGFIFDDSVNLGRFVEMRQGIEGLWQFLTHSGRPIAFLSFMLNDNIWPSTPESFIQTNVLLHLLCACLLMVCLILVGKNLGWEQRKRELIAMYASLAWLIHPLFVSTVLYIVQRMTILSAIFVLLSLISYLHGRLQLVRGDNKAWFWLIFGTAGFGLLGLLSKENAALIPIYLLVFEITLFAKEKQTASYYLFWKRCYIYLPVFIMFLCIFLYKESWINTFYVRDFNLIERLLTEANIVSYYLFLLLIPKSSTNGLHYENYPISTSLIEPWTTLPAVIFIIGIIYCSIFYRKKYPVFAFAMLFFFAGHLMESTFLALELYFEHRNYLPSMMFFFALTYGLFHFYEKYKRFVITIAITIIFTYSGLTYARSHLWGDQLLLLSVWTENNPGSSRNYIEGHIQAHRLKRYDFAKEFIGRGAKALPDNAYIWIGHTGYSCIGGTLKKSDIDKLKMLLEETEETESDYLYKSLERLSDVSFSPSCELITNDDLREILLSTLKNPNILKYDLRVHEMLHLVGRLELESENYSKAKEEFLESFLLNPHPNVALQQIALLATYNQYELAHDYLTETKDIIYEKYNIDPLKEASAWQNDFSYMESVLLEELESRTIDQ